MYDPPTAMLFQHSCIDIDINTVIDGNDDNGLPVVQCVSEVLSLVRSCAEFLQRANDMRPKPVVDAIEIQYVSAGRALQYVHSRKIDAHSGQCGGRIGEAPVGDHRHDAVLLGGDEVGLVESRRGARMTASRSCGVPEVGLAM